MILAGNRVLKRVAEAFADTLGFEHTLGAGSLNRNFGLHEPSYFKGRSEDLPGHTAQFPGEDLRQRVDLLLGHGRLHYEDALPVAFMNGFGPGDNRRAPYPREIDTAARAALDRHADEGAAAPILRVWEASKVAAAAEVAVAKLVALAFESP